MKNLQSFKKKIPFQYTVLISLVLIIGYIGILILLKNNSPLQMVTSDVFEIIINLAASLCLFYAAYKSRIYGKQIHYAWLLLAFAQLFYAAGDMAWTFIEILQHNAPFPSVADNLYLIYYILFAIGLVLLSRPIKNPGKLYKTILDAGIIIISAMFILWTTVNSTITDSTNNFLPLSLTIYYIIRDFVLFFLILNLIFRHTIKKIRDPFTLLLGGASAYILTDIAFSYLFLNGVYTSGNLVDVGWVIAFILIGLAGILQGNRANTESIKALEKIEKGSKPALASFIPLIWVGVAFFMLFWGHYQLPPANFANIQFRFVIFMVLILIRYVSSILEKRGFFHRLFN